MRHAAAVVGALLIGLGSAAPAWAGAQGQAPCPYGYDRPGAAVPPGATRPWGAAGGRSEAPERWFTLSGTVAQAHQAFAVGFKHQACGAQFGGQVGADGRLNASLASKVWPAKYWLAYQGQPIGELWVEANGQVRFQGKQGFVLTGAIANFR